MRRLTARACGWILGAAAVAASAAPPSAPAQRVGVGDDRSGYGEATYRSASRRVDALSGTPLDLAALARNPPLGLPPLPAAPEPAAAALGRRLFFDRRLSGNATLSCAMCHVPEQGFTQNELATPVGIEGRSVRRNAPALYNVAYRPSLFRDGRAATLEEQVISPLLAENEMGNPSMAAVVERIASDYGSSFREVFDAEPTPETLARALAAYQRTLLSADSPWDRWFFGGEPQAMSAKARRGFELFRQVGCAACHRIGEGSALFTDHGYHDTGVGHRSALRAAGERRLQIAPGVVVPLRTSIRVPHVEDLGRMEVTGSAEDRWKFRTPSLRNVAVTAPYMHDGSLGTLRDVVRFYAAGGSPHPGQDPRIRPLTLTDAEVTALVAFLESLTARNVDALAADARSVPIGDPAAKAAGRKWWSRGGSNP